MLPDQSDMEYHMPLLEEYASKCGLVIELGCGHGNGSTRAFMRGLNRSTQPKKLLISVDIDPERPQEVPDSPDWIKVTGSSLSVLTMHETCWEGYKRGFNGANLILIDTIHEYEQMKKELDLWVFLTTMDTVWLFHDTHMFGEYNRMTDAIKEFADREGWIYEDLSKESHGLGRMTHG